MSSDPALKLIRDAKQNSMLRRRLSQDRTSEELAESANREGYSISKRDAKRILAGAYLNSDSVSDEVKQEILGGFSVDFLDKVEAKLDRDFRFLEDKTTWTQAKEFYTYVFTDEE